MILTSGTAGERNRDLSIHEIVEERSRQCPEAVALSCGPHQLSYQQLNQRANQLAHHLRRCGVSPNAPVALYLERSLDMVVAILGVLKAGGAYLPIDLAYPKARVHFMLEDSKAPVLLTQQGLLDSLPEHQAKVICLDSAWDEISVESKDNPVSQTKGDDVAYIIFTSGSTGKPKGVLVTHHNVVRLFAKTNQWYHFDSNDVWTFFHSYAFDFSVWEIWGALFYGGRLVVVPYEISRSPEAFYELLGREGVTVLNQTPSAFRQLMWAEAGSQQRQALKLRYVIFGGEALELQSLKPWFDLHGDERPQLVNMYGITETTVHVTYRPIKLDDLASGLRSVIGVPIPDLRIYLLDEHFKPVPTGTVGEIYVGGPGVAKGYLNRPELTSQRFIADPFSKEPGARLYRSGDLAQYVANCELEYLGRADLQIKIRGFRIELGEIEAALNQHPSIQQCAVIASDSSGPDKRLIAYLVPQTGDHPSITELRKHLEQKIPDYMIPAAFVFLPALPLTPNGKLDHRALPAPDRARPMTATAYVAASPGVEETLAAIWSEVLKVDPIGINDNFFEMGGDSLLATQVVSRIRRTLHREVSQRDLFERPTIAQLCTTLENQLRSTETAIKPAPRDAELPLSFTQQRLWFLDQLEPGSLAYMLQQGLKLTGPLDSSVLERSLNEIVRRHEPLRTIFPDNEGRPWQKILPEASVTLVQTDLRHLPVLRDRHDGSSEPRPTSEGVNPAPLEDQRQAKAREVAVEEARNPINLKDGPVLRARLLRMEEQEHILLLTMHHITADGWSFAVLLNELSIIYQAFLAEKPSPLAKPAIQYADFAAWQRDWLVPCVMEPQIGYWRKQLADAPPLSTLATDFPRPQKQSYRGARVPVWIDAPLAGSFEQLCKQEGCTLFMGLLAALAVTIYRYTGQSDLLIGSPIANRNRAELEELIGCFINTLVLRADLSGEPTFRQLLKRVREMTLEAYAHQDLPFEKIVEELKPARNQSHSPFFQLMFVLQNTPPASTVGELVFNAFDVENGTAKFDLAISLTNSGKGISGGAEYASDLFEAATICGLLEHWKQLLESIVAAPDKAIHQIQLLSESEERQLLVEWNQTHKEYPTSLLVHEIIAAQAAATPSAIAVENAGGQLTYAQLDKRANEVAHQLRLNDVGPEKVVGVCVERSLDMVVAVLAVLKAGGAFVPLDPELPSSRQLFMIEDTAMPVLLTQKKLSKNLPTGGTKIICIEDCPETSPALLRKAKIEPSNAAYIIYTSGSTGQPKGVVMEHGVMVQHCLDCQMFYELTSADRVLHFYSLNFDPSIEQIFPTLMSGARVVLRDKELWMPDEFEKKIKELGLTLLPIPPVYWNQLSLAWAASPEPVPTHSVRLVVVGGEEMQLPTLNLWQNTAFNEVRLFNAYGPTETCVTASDFDVPPRRAGQKKFQRVPIGHPRANRKFYVLDSWGQPVPIGVPGELYIGGSALARGYLNRPELTKERFVPDPFNPGSRMYKTGDLARFLPDGNVEYLGRLDHQVKIRGFRVELGEIESALLKHPDIESVAVVTTEGADKQLIAYFVNKTDQAASTEDLREFLESRVPHYMIPSIFMPLDKLPLTISGKIDRKALPTPQAQPLSTPSVGPRTPEEAAMARVWCEVLGLKEVGVHDNFFALGGHSLLATQVASRIRRMLHREVSVSNLFEHPTIALLCAALEREAYKKDSLIQRAERGAEIPLSSAQQRLWFLERFEPGSITYLVNFGFRLTGTLDFPAFQASLNEIVRRHEALRTVFPDKEGHPCQTILPASTLPLQRLDLSQLPDAEAEAARIATKLAKEPIDLQDGPILRATLLHLGEQEHILLLNLHHIAFDGWSSSVFLNELSALYGAFQSGKPSPLPELPIQYADYALWQRNWLASPAAAEELGYWKKKLENAPPLSTLPTNHARPATQSYRGACSPVVVPAALADAVKKLCQEEGCTLFMGLLAAFYAVVHRYTGQNDLLIGSPIANRNRSEIEGLIGCFINTLVLRADLSGEPTFRQLLKQVREVTLESYAHQGLPFEKLVEELKPVRDQSYSPLFQLMFILQNTPALGASVGDLTFKTFEVKNGTTKCDLTLDLTETSEGLIGTAEYASDLFEDQTIHWLLAHWTQLLIGAVAQPDTPVNRLSLLSEAERKQILIDWNSTRREFLPPSVIHQFFEAQVHRTPDAIALVHGTDRLTYKELNKKANRLAHHLQELGVGPEVLTCICVERTPLMVIGLLAILKAGGAYVPLDPAYPKERLGFILEDTHTKVLLTTQSVADRLPNHSAQVVWLDQPLPKLSQENPKSSVAGDNLSYIIYTSGSTGVPKGVAIEHRNAAALINWAHEVYGDDERSGVLAATSLCFDLSIFEFFATLSWGGKVILAENVLQLPELPAASEVTLINTVPSAMAELLNLDAIPASVRTVNLAGEPLNTALVHQIYQKKTITKVYDLYGPSEDTTYSTLALRRPDGPATIGRPLLNKQVYILDSQLEPVPIGATGEIYIGGDGVARGYLNRTELTAEKFVSNPFSQHPGSRLYRTGDLARYRLNGDIEFLGRIDHQVKIRGFRIELGEIESVLNRHPSVNEASVLAREETPGQHRLVAFLAATPELPLKDHELRDFLKTRLPEHMIPSTFVLLPELPHNLNGKIDRKALLLVQYDSSSCQETYVAPRSETEIQLAEIWQTVLRLPRVGIHDNFFALGGHSLLATQVVSRVRLVLQRELSLRALFQHATVAQLAKTLEAQARCAKTVIKPVSREERLPLSFTQQRFWFLDQLEPGGIAYILQQCVRLTGPLEPFILERSLDEIVRRHEPLRTIYPDQQGRPWQEILARVSIKLPLIDLTAQPESERETQARQLAIAESTQPVNLKLGPIFRARLLRLGQENHILLLTMHHITADGWSFGVLLNELCIVYHAFLNGQPSPLPELTIQYADYAVWQREWLASGVMESQSTYWKKQLAKAPPLSSLPTDFPRPQNQSARGAGLPVSISAPVVRSIEKLCQEEDCTLFMGLLASFYSLVHRYTGQSDLLIGTPIANRNHAEIEGLIGCFINTLVLRTDLSGEPTFRQLLKRVREVTLEAFANQDMPFERMLEEVNPARNQSYAPLFQLMFILQNTPALTATAGDLDFKIFEVENNTTKFDMTLAVEDGPDGLNGEIEYSAELFEATTIQRLVDHWTHLLASAATQPDKPITQLEMLSNKERHQLLIEWNKTRVAYPMDQCVHQQVELQAAKSPEATAVECDGASLTYRQLNEQANQLAHLLHSMGVGLGMRVGLCLPRSLETVVGILGILKAGAAYIPLDPSYPCERLAFMLQDSKAPLVITDQEHATSKHLLDLEIKTLCLDRHQNLLAQQSRSNPAKTSGPGDLIYIIYTSGSTGRPKGAAVYQRGFANLLHWFITEFNISAADRVLLVSAQGFDLTQKNIFAPLMQGGALHLLPQGLYDPAKVVSLINQHKITLINCTPSAFYPLIESSDPDAFQKIQSLRCVFLGGEPIAKSRLRPWLENPCCRAEMDNTYGPTECSDISGFHRVTRENLDQFDFIPLGRPISNVSLAIVNSHLGLCPIGVPGELCIGGDGVGAGYLNDPALTAARFIPSPFPEFPNTRWYRSGDLVKLRPDGLIEYLGRMDNQVKIRGFRIELGEIEVVLRQHPNVREVVVVAQDSAANEKRLVAFLSVKTPPAPSSSELREFIKKSLPDYMVPSVFMILEALPLTPNGKVDQKALPIASEGKAVRVDTFVPPGTMTEKALARIWEEVLGIERVGLHDNFFDIGGHSLLATQMISRTQGLGHHSVSLKDIFEFPTVAGLGRRLEELKATGKSTAASLPPLIRRSRNISNPPLSP